MIFDAGSLVALIVALIGAAVALWSAYANKNEARRARREPTWVNLNDRVTILETEALQHKAQMGAVSRILHAIADQWPNHEGPDLDPMDMKLIEEAIPPLWVRPTHPKWQHKPEEK